MKIGFIKVLFVVVVIINDVPSLLSYAQCATCYYHMHNALQVEFIYVIAGAPSLMSYHGLLIDYLVI